MFKNLKDLRVVFMGTPDFAVTSLEKLLQAGINVVGVVTAPDKYSGRGMQLQQSAVKKFAGQMKLTILQPEKLKDPAFLESLKELKADLQVVVAFRMLPEIVWNMPPMGTINVHGSLLPQYRGAAPINWAIINGEKITGVTTFKLKHEIDTGDILLYTQLDIDENENAGELHDRMKVAGAELLLTTLKRLAEGSLQETPQSLEASKTQLKHAPKIFTTTCLINWNEPSKIIFDLIRGLAPKPGAYTYFDDKILKIFKAEKTLLKSKLEPGDFQTDKKTYLRFACTDGFIDILEMQIQGKKKMAVKDFLRGYHFTSHPD
ncbi:MAG: methionyl-tRNA formyltransferase [Ferruginibacter sp.]